MPIYTVQEVGKYKVNVEVEAETEEDAIEKWLARADHFEPEYDYNLTDIGAI